MRKQREKTEERRERVRDFQVHLHKSMNHHQAKIEFEQNDKTRRAIEAYMKKSE